MHNSKSISKGIIILDDTRLNSSNAEATFFQSTEGGKHFRKPSKAYHVGIHWIALAEYSQMSTHVPGFQTFFRFFALFCIGQI